MAFESTGKAPIKGHVERRTALINGQKFLHRQKLDQILIQKARKGAQEISGHCNFWTYFICTN